MNVHMANFLNYQPRKNLNYIDKVRFEILASNFENFFKFYKSIYLNQNKTKFNLKKFIDTFL